MLRYALAAVAVVIAVVAVFLFRPRPPVDLRDLATFPAEGPTSAVVRSPSLEDGTRELLEAGLAELEAGDHGAAEESFCAALDRDPAAIEAAYLLGLSQAVRGEVAEAIDALEAAVAGAPEEHRSKWAWVLANAYLKAGRIDEARAVLEENAAEGGDHAEKSRDLLMLISPGASV